jgi:hypothetical protein
MFLESISNMTIKADFIINDLAELPFDCCDFWKMVGSLEMTVAIIFL